MATVNCEDPNGGYKFKHILGFFDEGTLAKSFKDN